MKVEYDKDANAAYIYKVDEISEGKATKTIELNENIIIDFDVKGNLLGVEVLNADEVLNKELLVSNN
jgi:uncharacterized protein YuzE